MASSSGGARRVRTRRANRHVHADTETRGRVRREADVVGAFGWTDGGERRGAREGARRRVSGEYVGGAAAREDVDR